MSNALNYGKYSPRNSGIKRELCLRDPPVWCQDILTFLCLFLA